MVLASDADRERTVRRLRARHVEGLLGRDTFERRVEAALRARRRDQLDALLADLPRAGTALREAVTTFLGGRPDPGAGALEVALPAWAAPPLVLGRSRSCDVLVADATVSARHLELRSLDDHRRWLAVDLGSLNGTWLHDRRIGRTVVQPGDVLVLGETPVRFAAP